MKRVVRSSNYSAVSFDGTATDKIVQRSTKKKERKQTPKPVQVVEETAIKFPITDDDILAKRTDIVHEVVKDARIIDMENSIRHFLKKDSSFEFTHENMLIEFLSLAQNFNALLNEYNKQKTIISNKLSHFGSTTDFQPSWN